ncbi:MAG: GHKL domain-containing protein [candidate division Zixibacteria bacterium]|nr:GHKL domain-containing protein [candidate division Zixibacteria bacterium]
MAQTIGELARGMQPSTVGYRAVDRQTLALDALSKLTWQFAKEPDFRRLVDVLVLTISGQFTVGNAFAVVHNPHMQSGEPLCTGSGKFMTDTMPVEMLKCPVCQDYFLQHPHPIRVADLEDFHALREAATRAYESGVRLVTPLLLGDRVIGLIGLGEKVTRKPFGDDEVDLLATLANTITPFIVNSFLFMEIASLNAWYLDILDSVRQGVFVIGSDAKLQKVNSVGVEILKLCCGETIDMESVFESPLETLFPETSFPGWSRQFKLAAGRRNMRQSEHLVAKTADSERIFKVGFSRVDQGDGGEAGLVITLDDVTAIKESEERLFDLEKFADKGVMASSIAHELNNFLGMILGGVELTRFALNKGNVEKAGAALDKVMANGERMKRYTQGLTDFTRLETRKKIADINAVIADVLSFVRVQKKFTRIHISTELDAGLPQFEIDTDQIAQLLLNLVNNAADAIQEAGRDDGKVTVVTSGDKDSVTLTVSDNGCGIPPNVKEKLFMTHLTTKENGHGYGLVTCSRIIDHHHAVVTVDSEEGQGATFRLQFDLHPEEPSDAVASDTSPETDSFV